MQLSLDPPVDYWTDRSVASTHVAEVVQSLPRALRPCRVEGSSGNGHKYFFFPLLDDLSQKATLNRTLRHAILGLDKSTTSISAQLPMTGLLINNKSDDRARRISPARLGLLWPLDESLCLIATSRSDTA